MTRERHSVNPEERLRDSADKQVSIRWPIALDQRLDDLLDRADAVGENTNRRELLAALLFDADPSGDELRDLLQRYRTALVREAPLGDVEVKGDVLLFRKHRPGPRTAE
jgi:hypothetical protein